MYKRQLHKRKSRQRKRFTLLTRISTYAAVAIFAAAITSTVFLFFSREYDGWITSYVGGDGLEADVVAVSYTHLNKHFMHTRLIEFYRFDLPGDSIHTLNNIVSSSLGLDCPSIFFLADRQDIRRIRSRHNSQSISAMYGFDMIAAYSLSLIHILLQEG